MKKHCFYLLILCIPFIMVKAKSESSTHYWIVPNVEHPSVYNHYQPNQNIVINMAKGETEHVQIVIKTTIGEIINLKQIHPISNIKLTFRELKNINGYADALVPISNRLICTDTLTTIWATYKSTTKTKPQNISNKLIIESLNRNHQIKIQMQVHNVEIPICPSIPIVAGVETNKLVDENDAEAYDKAAEQWSDFLLDYRISPMFGTKLNEYDHSFSPWKWNDKRSLKLLKDKRYSAFVLPYYALNYDELKQMLSYLKKRELINHSFFYVFDEPAYIENYETIRNRADSIHAIEHNAKLIIPFFCGPRNGEHKGELYAIYDELKDKVNIFVMSLAPHKGNEESVETSRIKVPLGADWWSYICWEPIGEEPNFLLKMKGIQQRAIMWRTWKNKSKGFLYWDTNIYHQRNPFTYITDMPHGDGLIVYPGDVFRIDGPIASARLERWRDGAEEFELLNMARQKGLEKEAEEVLRMVYKSPTDYNYSVSLPDFKKKLMELAQRNN